jgi:ABC-type dipeptide/oligopeptide/nickel transport system permease component
MKFRYYVIRRLLLALFVLIGLTAITFTISRMIPNDPARMWTGPRASAQQVEQARHELRLDKPVIEQYWYYLLSLMKGDLGVSIHTRRPVMDDIRDYFWATFELTDAAILVAIAVGIPLGVISATRKDRVIDHVTRLFSLSGVSVPIFWLGIILQLFFASWLGFLPTGGRVDPFVLSRTPIRTITGMYLLDSLLNGNWAFFESALAHMILPLIALSYASLATITRMTRSAMLEVLRQDYVRTARSKGLSERVVIYRHALRNALIPTTTVIGLTYAFMLGGDFLVETIFDWPGIGRYAVDSIVNVDFPAVAGVTLLAALIYTIVNLLVDMFYAIIDPRIKYG